MASMILRDGRCAEVASVRRLTDHERARLRVLHALTFKGQGWTGAEIAEYFNVTRRTVTRWFRDVPADAARMAL